MSHSCVIPPHRPSLLRSYQKLAAAPPTVPQSPVFFQCRSFPTGFPPLPILPPPWESPTSHMPSNAASYLWSTSEIWYVSHPPSSPFPPKVPKHPSQRGVPPVSPPCITFPPLWGSTLPFLATYPTPPHVGIYYKLIPYWIKSTWAWLNQIEPSMNIISRPIQSGIQEPNSKYYLGKYFTIS